MPVYPGAPQHSTGPRAEAGKQRSALNATTHGLAAKSVIVPAEEEAAYQQLCQKFFDEYKPATATEAAMVQQLADTSWRLNRIPRLDDAVLTNPTLAPQEAIEQISRLGLYSSRLLSTVKQLHQVQDDRRQRECCEFRKAAELLIQHDRQGIQWDPADDGFVFSRQQVEQFATREMRLNNARIYSSAACLPPPVFPASSSQHRRPI